MKKDVNDTKKSPLALEGNTHFLANKKVLNSIPAKKKMVFEQNDSKSTLLDESNIKE